MIRVFGQPGSGLIARLEHRRENRGNRSHAARRGGYAIRCEPEDAVDPLELGDQLFAQRDQALRVRVERLAVIDGPLARLADVLRGREVRLPDVQLDRPGRATGFVPDLADARVMCLRRRVRQRRKSDARHVGLHPSWARRGASR